MNPGTKLQELLSLKLPPVAVVFRRSPPHGVGRVDAAAAAGCGYWLLAAQGRTFYTEAADHHGCTIGAFTHGVDLPPEKAKEQQDVIQTMVGLEYIRREDLQLLPRRTAPFGVAVYAPLSQAPVDPDVVLVRGNAKQVMLVAEAAHAIGIGQDGAVMGRPACSMIPASIDTRRGATSLGCIGNRVYTGLGDDELYFAIPGPRLHELVVKLEKILTANRLLERFHEDRKPAARPC